MRTKVLLCHGNVDTLTFIVDDLDAALTRVIELEAVRGHSLEALKAYFTHESEDGSYIQYGSNYHYAVFERVTG